MKKIYIPRLFDEILDFSLKSKGAVIVVGPKWCGKSTTCARHAKTIIDLMRTQDRIDYINLAKASPESIFNYGPIPILIDEWQHLYFLYDDLKWIIDKRKEFGQFILTGSVSNNIKNDGIDYFKHTGNGRFIEKMMRTMSLYESGDSNGSVSLLDLKKNKFKPSISDKTIYDYAYYICRGGWPLSINNDKKVSLQQAKDYYEMIVKNDIFSNKDIPLFKNESKARQILRSYSRNISFAASDVTLIEDCVDSEETFDKDTFIKYILSLKSLYVIDELPAWNPNLRSKTAIRSKPTRHFIDPSIAAAALNLTPESIFKDIKTFGLLFESLVIRDLRVYADSINARVYKYRDSKNREVDAVIVFEDGTFGLIEVKLGNNDDIDVASKKLISLSKDINEDKTGSLAFLMVICKNKIAYRREDGVYVVPLSCLRN